MTDKYAPVNTKQDFVRRYALGEFGNAAPTWDNVKDYLASNYRGLVHIRNRIAGGMTWYDVDPLDFTDRWQTACRYVEPANLYISGMSPTDKTIIQGELMQTDMSIELYYTKVRRPMRDALKEKSLVATGITAAGLLKTYLNPLSYDWIQTLLRRYPGHVIEFSTYSICWGTLPGYNTVFWEVRNY